MDQGKFQGALIGTFVGDALGMPVEGMDMRQIYERFDGPLRDMVDAPRRHMKAGTYTDDTEMMIGLAEGLAFSRRLDCAAIGARFVDNFHMDRGYGRGTVSVLKALRKGAQWDEPARGVFNGEGSYGNGAAMRIAPVGCVYYDMHDKLRNAAEMTSMITHAHPLGKEAGAVQAMAVALAMGADPAKELNPSAFIDTLIAFTDVPEFVDALNEVKILLERALVTSPMDAVETLGNDIRGYTAVPAAIFSFLHNHRSFEAAVIYAVNLGGDTDTIGAMAGAIAGAYHGIDAVPARWLDKLENEGKGRDYVLDLGRKLWEAKGTGDF
jgi:poly(ADP-ribose) glycohydrolase ARH3